MRLSKSVLTAVRLLYTVVVSVYTVKEALMLYIP
jgi:hypothetical protein